MKKNCPNKIETVELPNGHKVKLCRFSTGDAILDFLEQSRSEDGLKKMRALVDFVKKSMVKAGASKEDSEESINSGLVDLDDSEAQDLILATIAPSVFATEEGSDSKKNGNDTEAS